MIKLFIIMALQLFLIWALFYNKYIGIVRAAVFNNRPLLYQMYLAFQADFSGLLLLDVICQYAIGPSRYYRQL